ncbi:T9SS type A sorting domain-containing protein [Pseudocnuella soli]|uniref:T9SS type A sorting domain-containing protein n=1 Tax=Pseudocnuella soli TaxID=2502779 RepID=UPI00104B1BA1|nr:T9SS type A sorting domain-containing protein [Pseudocnuella soli]
MKRLLLSLALMGAVLLGNAQVVLNEIYVDPATNKNHSEFFELYNTSILPTPINLDCYTLVSYKKAKNGNKTLFVIDLPNQTINPKSYYVGAASNPLNVQGKINQPLNFSWSDPGLAALGGSITKYVLNNDGTAYASSAPTAAERQDIFFTNEGSPTYGVFLFNNGVYVNGFLGGYSLATPPPAITTLPAITNLTNACGTYSLTFSSITKNEFVGPASGTDNGYIREGDGLCGTWAKASNNHTPGTENPGSTTSTGKSSLTTSQILVCGNRIDFTITAPIAGTAYPVEVQLYIDKDKDGSLDATDEYITTYPNPINGGTTTVYTFSSLAAIPSTSQYLIVYKTALGCFDKFAIPDAVTGSLSASATSYCKQRVDFAVTNGNVNLPQYAYPVTVELHFDLNKNGVIDAGDLNGSGSLDAGDEDFIVDSKVITSATTGTGSFINVDPNQDVILVFNSSIKCLMPANLKPLIAGGTISPVAKSYCGQRVDFSIPTGTLESLKYSFPVTVELYYDLNINGVVDENENTVIGTRTVTSASSTLYSFENLNPERQVLLVFKSAYNCFMPAPLRPTPVTGTYTTTEANYCSKQLDVSVTGISGDAAIYPTYAQPINVTLYYDLNSNGTLEIGEDAKDVEEESITNLSGAPKTFFIDEAHKGKLMFVVYQSPTACFYKVATVSASGVSQSITDAQVFEKNTVPSNVSSSGYVNFDLLSVSNNITSADFPIMVKVYSHEVEAVINESTDFVMDDFIASVAETQRTVNITRGDYATLRYYSKRGCLLREVTLAPIAEAITPVKFSSFTAARNKGNKQQVELTWTTAQEQNNKGFYLQRKTGNEWKDVAFVFSAAEGGNSSEALTYRFKDANTHPGVSQYRLLQVDLDGKATYSNIVSLMGETPKSSVVIYPNPAVGGHVNLVFADGESAKQVLVSDLSGRVVQQYRNITTASHAISGLKTGFYTIKVINAKTGETVVEKIIVP